MQKQHNTENKVDNTLLILFPRDGACHVGLRLGFTKRFEFEAEVFVNKYGNKKLEIKSPDSSPGGESIPKHERRQQR